MLFETTCIRKTQNHNSNIDYLTNYWLLDFKDTTEKML